MKHEKHDIMAKAKRKYSELAKKFIRVKKLKNKRKKPKFKRWNK